MIAVIEFLKGLPRPKVVLECRGADRDREVAAATVGAELLKKQFPARHYVPAEIIDEHWDDRTGYACLLIDGEVLDVLAPIEVEYPRNWQEPQAEDLPRTVTC